MKSLDISKATARVASELLKALAILPDATIKISAVVWEDMKTHCKLVKMPNFLSWLTNLSFRSF